jgi:uncharacterized membrane protein HdeD (DUF308 family)
METLIKNWWWFVLRGVLGIVFGVLTFLWPFSSLAALVLLFGAYAMVDGVFSLVAAIRRPPGDARPWWALLLQGISGIAAGVLTLFVPGITALALLYLIAAWALVTGVFAIVSAIRLRKEITGEVWLGLSGLLSIAFGVLLFLFPGPGALAVTLWIGAYAFVFGVMLVALGLKLRGHVAGPHAPPAPHPA